MNSPGFFWRSPLGGSILTLPPRDHHRHRPSRCHNACLGHLTSFTARKRWTRALDSSHLCIQNLDMWRHVEEKLKNIINIVSAWQVVQTQLFGELMHQGGRTCGLHSQLALRAHEWATSTTRWDHLLWPSTPWCTLVGPQPLGFLRNRLTEYVVTWSKHSWPCFLCKDGWIAMSKET